MRLVLPPGLCLFFCRELGELHAVDSHSDSSELLGHVNDEATTSDEPQSGASSEWLQSCATLLSGTFHVLRYEPARPYAFQN